MTIYWFCDNKNCSTHDWDYKEQMEQRSHKRYQRKRGLLDNGRLDEDDELVVFSEVYGTIRECDVCGDARRPVLNITRFDWDDPPGWGEDNHWVAEISDAVAIYQRNGWYPKQQRRLF